MFSFSFGFVFFYYSLIVWYLHKISSLFVLHNAVCEWMCWMSLFPFVELYNEAQTGFLFTFILCIIHKAHRQHLMQIIDRVATMKPNRFIWWSRWIVIVSNNIQGVQCLETKRHIPRKMQLFRIFASMWSV